MLKWILLAALYLLFATGGYIASANFQNDAAIVHVINGLLWPLHVGHALTTQSLELFNDMSL